MHVKHPLNAFQVYDIISGKVNQVAISNPIKKKVIAEANAYYPVWVQPIKVKKKKGQNVAVARKMLEVIWHILRYKEMQIGYGS